MLLNRSYQKGASLVESLIALAILLFILFTVFILFNGIISSGYSLNTYVKNNQGLHEANEEYKRTGVLSDEHAANYDVVSSDNGDDTYNQHLCVKGSSGCSSKQDSSNEPGTVTPNHDNEEAESGELSVVPYVRINSDNPSDWQNKSTIAIKPTDTVDFAPHANINGTRVDNAGGSWSWSGCFSTSGGYVSNKTFASSCTEKATYTYTDGTTATQNFSINVYTADNGGSGGGENDGSGSIPFVVHNPIAQLNKVSCTEDQNSNDVVCTFNAIGSEVAHDDGGSYKYYVETASGGTDDSWTYSTDGGSSYSSDIPIESAANDNVSIKFASHGEYNVYVDVSDVYGKTATSSPSLVEVVWPPIPKLTATCDYQQCKLKATGSTVFTDNPNYTYSFPGTTISDITVTDPDAEQVVYYDGKQNIYDTDAYFTQASQNFNIILSVQDGDSSATDTEEVTINAAYIDISWDFEDIGFNPNTSMYLLRGPLDIATQSGYGMKYDTNDFKITVVKFADDPSTPWTGQANYDTGIVQTPITKTNVPKNADFSSQDYFYSWQGMFDLGGSVSLSQQGWYNYCISGKGYSLNCGNEPFELSPPSFDIKIRTQYHSGGYLYMGGDTYNVVYPYGGITSYELYTKENGTKRIFSYDDEDPWVKNGVSSTGNSGGSTTLGFKALKTDLGDWWNATTVSYCLKVTDTFGRVTDKCDNKDTYANWNTNDPYVDISIGTVYIYNNKVYVVVNHNELSPGGGGMGYYALGLFHPSDTNYRYWRNTNSSWDQDGVFSRPRSLSSAGWGNNGSSLEPAFSNNSGTYQICYDVYNSDNRNTKECASFTTANAVHKNPADDGWVVSDDYYDNNFY